MKKIIYKLIFLVPLLVLLVVVNLLCDPLHIFNYSYERKLSESLLEGESVEVYNYDERILQKYLISMEKNAKDTIVLGSSRAMQISSETLNYDELLNNCVSGATLEDYVAIYSMYKEKGELPKNIIIGVDPWIFNKNNSETRWKSISKYYYRLVDDIDSVSINKTFDYQKYKQLFSLSYFQDSVNILFSKDEKEVEGNIKRPDGSLSYNSNYANVNVNVINQRAKDYINGADLNGLINYTEIDPEYEIIFTELINMMIRDGINIIFFFPPYHPLVYQFIYNEDGYDIVIDVENYLRDLAKANNIETIGSYNPDIAANTPIPEMGFYDGFHPIPKYVDMIFENCSLVINN